MSYNPALRSLYGVSTKTKNSLENSANDMFARTYSIWDRIFWVQTLRSAIGLQASPPPLLSHQGHASCCAARSFFFFFFSPVFSMHGESHIWSAEGERCRPFRAHVVIATHLVGAPFKNRPVNPSLDIGCSYLEKTFHVHLGPGRAHSLL